MTAQSIAAKGGQSTSEKKKAASRANGMKGGRPNKVNSRAKFKEV